MPVDPREPRGESKNSHCSDFAKVNQQSPSLAERMEKERTSSSLGWMGSPDKRRISFSQPSSPHASMRSHLSELGGGSYLKKLTVSIDHSPDREGTFDMVANVARPKSVDLIESLYGTSMAEIVHWNSGSRTRLAGLTAFFLLVNIVFQCYLLYAMKVYICAPAIAEIRHVYSDFRDETHIDGTLSEEEWHAWDSRQKARLCQIPLSQPVLFAMLLMIWTSYVLIDVRETVVYAWAWVTLPHPSSQNAELRDGVTVSLRDDMVTCEAASHKVKVVVLLFVLLPKFVIAIVLWYLGALWLTATPSFENLVLNAAALVFITNIDEVLYTAWASSDLKLETTKTQIRLPAISDTYKRSHGFWEMIFMTLLNMIVPLLYVFHAQLVIPDYHWDLSSLCTGKIDDWNRAAQLTGVVG